MSELWTPGQPRGQSREQQTFSQMRSGLNRDAALSGEQASDPVVAEMRLNRKANMAKTGRGSTDLRFATGRPQDPMFYWRQNNLQWDVYDEEQLAQLRMYCRMVGLTHPVVASAVDIFSRYPLTGLEFRCLAGETEVVTGQGLHPIRELSGGVHEVITSGGQWVDAKFESFGTQRLYRLVVRRNGRERVIHATADHRWFVDDHVGPGRGGVGEDNPSSRLDWDQVQAIRHAYEAGGVRQVDLARQHGISQPMVGKIVRGEAWAEPRRQVQRRTPVRREVETIDLAPGDRLTSTYAVNRVHSTNPSPFGVAHGFVVGDGHRKSDGNGCVVTLWGAKDLQLLPYFEGCTQRAYERGSDVESITVSDLPGFFKDLPALDESVSYLYGWLAGYFAADGTVSKKGECFLDSVSLDNIRHAQAICRRFGIHTYDPYEIERSTILPSGQPYSGMMHRLPLDAESLTEAFFLLGHHRERYLSTRGRARREQWVVVSVEETDRVEEVYCAVVPETESFVLDGDILTGNSKDSSITSFYETLMLDQLDYEEFLTDVGREYWTAGEAWPLGTFNELLGVWEDDELINPDDVRVIKSPFLREPRFEMRLPESIREIINNREPLHEYQQLIRNYPELVNYAREDQYMPVSNVLMRQLKFKADTFNPRGVPILMRGFRALMQEEMLNSAQDAVASRLYTPLILARLGATAQELGTEHPWIPNQGDMQDFQEAVDAALAGDFRMLTYHFGVRMESVFGREMMPRLEQDFARLEERILQVFGLSKTMLSGGSSGQTYAADALNRDLITQLLATYQRLLKRFVKDRMLVVAEAQEHYDYEIKGGKRYPIMEEVLEVDEETGEQYVVEQPKLLVPDVHIRAMNMRDEDSFRQFIEALRADGVPISMKTRLTNVPIDLDDEMDSVREEQVQTAIEAQRARKETFEALRAEGLPIPADLREDFEPKATVSEGAPESGVDNEAIPGLGDDLPADDVGLVPTDEDRNGEGEPALDGDANGKVVRLPRNRQRQRPEESDEQRDGMPKPASAIVKEFEVTYTDDEDAEQVRREARYVDPETGEQRAGSLQHGPRHVGMRRRADVRSDKPLADHG